MPESRTSVLLVLHRLEPENGAHVWNVRASIGCVSRELRSFQVGLCFLRFLRFGTIIIIDIEDEEEEEDEDEKHRHD